VPWYLYPETDIFPPVSKTPDKLGIIAGNRSLPLVLAKEARAAGVQQLVAAAFENETDPALTDLVDTIEWLRVGQLSKLIGVFKSRNISQCVMVGQIAPKNLFDLRPDLRAVKLLASINTKNAHSIFGAIADELNKEGITLIEATPWLEPAMPKTGFCLGPGPSNNQLADIEFGHTIAKEISRLEIGQTVIVKNGTVLAVEGFEGTDDCLKRGGQLAGKDGGAIAVKVAKAHHDLRFDIPCLGSRTLETCASAGISAIAFDAGSTLLLDREHVELLAEQHDITVKAV
jgi:DUF1009 family protein